MVNLYVHLKSEIDASSIDEKDLRRLNKEIGSPPYGFGYDSEGKNQFIWYPLNGEPDLEELSERLSKYPFFERLEIVSPAK